MPGFQRQPRYRLNPLERPTTPPPDVPRHPPTPAQYRIINDVLGERARQDAKWGLQHHPNGTSSNADARCRADDARTDCQIVAENGEVTWRHIATEEFFEALAETDPAALRAELVQVAAVVFNWIEDLDSRTAPEAES